jgi:hypothetical protein
VTSICQPSGSRPALPARRERARALLDGCRGPRSTGAAPAASRRIAGEQRFDGPVERRDVILSTRSARASGLRRIASIGSRRPSRIPACGPPSSLSPEKQTTSTPSSSRAGRSNSRAVPAAQIDQRGAAEILQQRNAGLARDRRERVDPTSAT